MSEATTGFLGDMTQGSEGFPSITTHPAGDGPLSGNLAARPMLPGVGTFHWGAAGRSIAGDTQASNRLPANVGVTLLRGRASVLEASECWRHLEASHSVGPFQRRAWALAWLATLGEGSEPWILTAGSPAVSLLPLVLVRRHGLRVIRLLGHGVSDYVGAVPVDSSAEVYRAFGAELSRHAQHYDLIDLQSLDATEDRRRAISEGIGRPSIERVYEICPVIKTQACWAAFLASRRKRFRANLKRAHRRLCKHGDMAVRRESPSAALMDEMASVERESWKWTKGSSFLRDPGTRAFLETVLLKDVVPHEVWTIRSSGELAGFAVVFIADKTRYYYLPSFRERYSDAGTLLLSHIVRDSFDGHWQELDLLRGDERYKLAWAHEMREVHELAFAGRTLRGHVALLGARVRWRLAASRSARCLYAALIRLYGMPRSGPGASGRNAAR